MSDTGPSSLEEAMVEGAIETDSRPETGLSLISPASLEVVETRLNEFRAFVHRVLKKGVDYGTIPGTKKDTLLKPGAERILQLYGLTPIVVMDAAVEDFSSNPPLFNYRVKIQLLHRGSGEVIGEGVGSCNSMEKKYRYRTEWWQDKKNPPGPADGTGWQRKNGKWGAAWCRQTVSEDTAEQANTILKMAKKRALIDAALTVGAASEFFTQDMDDFPPEERRGRSVPSKEAVIAENEHVEDPDEALFEDLAQSIVFVELKKALAAGFNSVTHQQNWLKKHKPEIDALPEAAKDKLRQLYLHAEVKGGTRSVSAPAARTLGVDEGSARTGPHPEAPKDSPPPQAGGAEEAGSRSPARAGAGAEKAAGTAARDQIIRLADREPGGEG